MMNKKTITLVGFLTLISFNTFASQANLKINFKKTYCGNVDYLGNSATKRPHLHCGEHFIAYKKNNGDHLNIAESGTCARTDLVFDEIKANRNAFADYQGIYNALVAYHQSGCPNQ
ncbi:hypothetical protein [Fluoribacter dumoffii]|uniref:hypothetical protein n=2 Tax=Fluoribacter dumoffii TaxID=463 RepID=UPI0002D51EE7|nr:hypothetical protein [Fluoribacter dumoffii]